MLSLQDLFQSTFHLRSQFPPGFRRGLAFGRPLHRTEFHQCDGMEDAPSGTGRSTISPVSTHPVATDSFRALAKIYDMHARDTSLLREHHSWLEL